MGVKLDFERLQAYFDQLAGKAKTFGDYLKEAEDWARKRGQDLDDRQKSAVALFMADNGHSGFDDVDEERDYAFLKSFAAKEPDLNEPESEADLNEAPDDPEAMPAEELPDGPLAG